MKRKIKEEMKRKNLVKIKEIAILEEEQVKRVLVLLTHMR